MATQSGGSFVTQCGRADSSNGIQSSASFQIFSQIDWTTTRRQCSTDRFPVALFQQRSSCAHPGRTLATCFVALPSQCSLIHGVGGSVTWTEPSNNRSPSRGSRCLCSCCLP